MRSFASLVFLPVILAACGGAETSSTSSTPSTNPPASSSPDEPTKEPTTETSQAGSVWHKEQVDATNLRIDSDGHFRWTISGCDFGGGDEGRWEAHQEGGIVLLPANGHDFFEWSHEGFKDRALALRLTREGDGVKITGSMEDGSTITQTWKSGCACAICGGDLGPTGQEACTDPKPEICIPK